MLASSQPAVRCCVSPIPNPIPIPSYAPRLSQSIASGIGIGVGFGLTKGWLGLRLLRSRLAGAVHRRCFLLEECAMPLRNSSTDEKPASYDAVGVVAAGRDANTLGDLGQWVTKTFAFNAAKPLLPLGYYANILPLTAELGLAISTDGVEIGRASCRERWESA